MNENEKAMPTLASEIYADLKQEIRFKNKLIFVLIGIVCALIIALAATHIYHIYQWSQFDTVIIDSGDGGNAAYSEGENNGGIYQNGTDSSQTPEGPKVQGQAD